MGAADVVLCDRSAGGFGDSVGGLGRGRGCDQGSDRDGGGLDDSWRQEPGTPVYGADLDADGDLDLTVAREPDINSRQRSPYGAESSFARRVRRSARR